MSKIDDGGAAFPGANDESTQYNYCNRGMTLRDYFAAKALPILMQRAIDSPNRDMSWRQEWDRASKEAFAAADAMISARKEQP